MRDSLMCPSRFVPDEGRDPTELEDDVLGLLEAAGMGTEWCDRIMAIIDEWQLYTAPKDHPEAGFYGVGEAELKAVRP